MITQYENLANAVVATAFKDYKKVLTQLKKNPSNVNLLYEKKSLEKFFLGERLLIFTKVDGRYLIDLAKREVYKEK